MIKWYSEAVLQATNSVIAEVSEDVADDVVADAKRILTQKAKTTSDRGLLTQFSITKSKFKYGGFLVQCQGPGNWHKPYHASFLEMGTYKDEAKPFMRPALKKNKSKAYKKYQDELEKKYRATR